MVLADTVVEVECGIPVAVGSDRFGVAEAEVAPFVVELLACNTALESAGKYYFDDKPVVVVAVTGKVSDVARPVSSWLRNHAVAVL